MTPAEYCQEKAARSGSSFYYSFMFLSPAQRHAMIALYAYCREVDDVVDECDDPSIARVKLQWWRDELNRLYEGSPQHPVTKALAEYIEKYNLPMEHFLEVLDGMEMDLDISEYPTFKELSLYCHRVASMVGIMSVEIFGYENRGTLKYAHDLGMAFQLTNILRDVREDASLGRIYIPMDELSRFNVSLDDVVSSRMTENARELFAFQAQRARGYYKKAFSHLPEEDRYQQRSGLIMAAIYQTLLDEIEADGFNVLQRRVKLTPLRKLWIAWRTARREKRHARRLAIAH